MHSRTIELLENLEEKIENIKWLVTMPFAFNKTSIPPTISLIRKSAGILGKANPKGTVFENKIRKEWRTNLLKRTT